MLIWQELHKSCHSLLAKIGMILPSPAQDARICGWFTLVLGRRQQAAPWALGLVAGTVGKAAGGAAGQELQERCAQINPNPRAEGGDSAAAVLLLWDSTGDTADPTGSFPSCCARAAAVAVL